MKIKKSQKGQALLLVLIFISVFTITLVGGAQLVILVSQKTSRQSMQSVDTYALGEGGVEDAILRLRRDPSIGQNSSATLILTEESGNTVSTLVEPVGQPANSRRITATGTRENLVRKIRTELVISEAQEASFYYAVQIGNNGLTMYSNSVINGNAYSNGDITGDANSRIEGDAYAHGTISTPNPRVSGRTVPDSPIQEMPFIDLNYWENQANINNDPYEGNLVYDSGNHDLGPKRINGNLTLGGSSVTTVKGPIYVTGNFAMESNSIIKLDQAFGSQGTVLIVDGTISLSSNSQVLATTATPKGYLLMLSTLNSYSPAAISISSNSTTGLIYAYNGAVQLNSNARVTSVTGQQIVLNSNAVLTYDIGLASAEFVSGPGGGWAITSWEEIE